MSHLSTKAQNLINIEPKIKQQNWVGINLNFHFGKLLCNVVVFPGAYTVEFKSICQSHIIDAI
jgi:hypothetical protein